MGSAARRNPRALTAGRTREDVGGARMAYHASFIRTPRQFGAFLHRFPEADRERVRVAMRRFVDFDAELIAKEEADFAQLVRQQAAYGQRPIINRGID